MAKKAVIFGASSFAEVVHFYLTHDSAYEVAAFTVTRDSVSASEFLELPLVPFEEIEESFGPADHDMFVAVGYRKLNTVRERFFNEAKAKGYHLLSYMCSRASHWNDTVVGENCFIFEDNTIQPFVTIADDTILWSGNHVGHHSRIGPHCFVTSHTVISGHCSIGSHCFIGVNATISEDTAIGDRNIIGPGTLIQKTTGPDEVFVAERTKKFAKDSSRFFR